MQKAWAAKNGFTIIEILVSIVIIGILITITTVSYNGIQQRSRDSERGSHVTILKVALDKYRADKSAYPNVCPGGDNAECSVSALATELQPYLKNIPHDPRQVVDSAEDYRYIRGASSTDSYGLRVSYEAKPVCKTGHNVIASWWTAALPTC